jgi:rhodanese-related sulfurtransferase
MKNSLGRRYRDNIYEQFARVGKAFSAPKRVELLELLCQSPRTVEALAELASISVANASQHLRLLRACRLVEAEKKGLFVEYRLSGGQVERFMFSLRELAQERLAEIEQVTRAYLTERGAMESVPGDELLRRVRDGTVTVLDVRPVEEYSAGHIPGAISVPLPQLEGRIKELPSGRAVVAYCRGPYCVMAVEAVQLLRNKGLSAFRMKEGVTDWRSRGWPVETGWSIRKGARPWRKRFSS